MTTRRREGQRAVQVKARPDELPADALARFSLTPTIHAAAVVQDFVKIGKDELDLNSLITELRAQSAAASRGDLARAEAMLVSQAHTLDALFGYLARRSKLNMDQYLDAADRFMRLALRAQGQCRATLETLAAIKNPPVVFARQANIAHGPQQVNNGPAPEGTRAGNSEKAPIELLEELHDERLDPGATGAASGADTNLETMGAVNRPKD